MSGVPLGNPHFGIMFHLEARFFRSFRESIPWQTKGYNMKAWKFAIGGYLGQQWEDLLHFKKATRPFR
jgi:hypothetical protein